MATDPISSQPSLPTSNAASASGLAGDDGVGWDWAREPSGTGFRVGSMVQRGQKVFHLCHSPVLRIVCRTSAGGAAMYAFAMMLIVPPGPWVGTVMGGTREAVTGAEGVRGVVVVVVVTVGTGG